MIVRKEILILKREYKYFVKRIDDVRTLKSIKLENLARTNFISKSYLSKIKNLKHEIDNELLFQISNSLDLEYYYDTDLISKNLELLENFYISLVFHNPRVTEEILQIIKKRENIYLNSSLIFKYILYKYVWLSINGTSNEETNNIEKFIETEFIATGYLDSHELQIYYDAKGCIRLNSENFDDAILYYNKALSFGIHKYSYSITCYHLGKTLCLINNLFDAMYYDNIALEYFTKEYNIVRQLFTQVHMANIYGKSKQFIKAENIYKEILLRRENNSTDDIFCTTIKTNLSWLYISQKRYNDAIKIINEKTKDELIPIDYFHLALCYYEIKDFIAMENTIDSAKHNISNVNNIMKRLELLTYVVNEDNNSIVEKIENEYIKERLSSDTEEKVFYLNLMIHYCEKESKYKKALGYLKELYNLQN